MLNAESEKQFHYCLNLQRCWPWRCPSHPPSPRPVTPCHLLLSPALWHWWHCNNKNPISFPLPSSLWSQCNARTGKHSGGGKGGWNNFFSQYKLSMKASRLSHKGGVCVCVFLSVYVRVGVELTYIFLVLAKCFSLYSFFFFFFLQSWTF